MGELTVIPSDEYVELWMNIYQGCPSWVKTKYATLTGRIQKRDRKQFKGAKMVSKEFTDLMFSESPIIKASPDLQAILDRSGWDKNNTPFIEKVLALGGGAYKLYSKDSELYIDYVTADRFVPVSWSENGIYEADFLDYKYKDKKKFLRVEKHRKEEGGYRILQEFYQIGDNKMLTKATPAAAGYSIPEDEMEGVFIPTENPLFSYIKLPMANNFDFDSPLGISVYGNSVDTLEGLDVAFDAFQQEITLGKKRIIVPTSAVRKVVDPETGDKKQYFDPSDEIYQAFDTDDKENLKIMDNSVVLRISEIRDAIQTYLDILSIQVGFSAGYLTFDGASGVKTATEVISDNSKTYKTKVGLENALLSSYLDLVQAIEGVSGIFKITVGDHSYEFQDSIIEDRDSKTNYWTERLDAGTITLEEFLMKVDGLTETEANKKAEEIRKKKATGNVNDTFELDDNNNMA